MSEEHTFKTAIVIHAKWKKPWFGAGYTQYTIVRETTRHYATGWSRESMTDLFKTDNLEAAERVKKEMIEAGVTTA